MAPMSGQAYQEAMHKTSEACMYSEGIVCTSHVVWLNNASLRYTDTQTLTCRHTIHNTHRHTDT